MVGGKRFLTELSTLLKSPDSFFTSALQMHDAASSGSMIIDRDSTNFEYILDFLRYDFLPRDSFGQSVLPMETLQALKLEAEFYGLSELSDEVRDLMSNVLVADNLPSKTLKSLISGQYDWTGESKHVEFKSKDPLALVNILG